MRSSSAQLQIHSLSSRAQHFNKTLSIGRVFKGKMPNRKDQSSNDLMMASFNRPQTTMISKRNDTKNSLPQRATTSYKVLRNPIESKIQEDLIRMDRKEAKNSQIYYANAQFKNILQQNKFPKGIQSLKPNDNKSFLILSIVQKQFPEIEISDFNLLICHHNNSLLFYVFFSDSEWVPFSKCCDVPIYVLIQVDQSKLCMFCNKCDREMIEQKQTQDLIYFRTGSPKPSNMQVPFFDTPSKQRDQLKLSKFIITGQFKHLNMQKEYRQHQLRSLKMQATLPSLQKLDQLSHTSSKKFVRLTAKQPIINTDGNDSTILEIKNIINAWMD